MWGKQNEYRCAPCAQEELEREKKREEPDNILGVAWQRQVGR